MNELISIIVPVYNVEKYLNKCVDSILAQTYTNIEVILVDDGATDTSGSICDTYKKDSRVKVVHKENGGLSDARNAGIEASTGEYLVFIDSDDFIDSKMIETLYNAIVTTNSDISICDFVFYSENEKKYNKYSKTSFIIEGEEKFKYLYNEFDVVSIVQWNKIYRKSIFKDIKYPYQKINEDEFVIANEFYNARKISYILKPLYFYRQREDSIMGTFNVKRFNAIEAYENRINFYEEKKLYKYKLKTMIDQLNLLTRLFEMCAKTSFSKEENKYINKIIKIVRKNTKKLVWKKVDVKTRLKALLFVISPKLVIKYCVSKASK